MRNNTPALLTHRTESWRWDLLDLNDNKIGELKSVQSGTFEYSIHNTIRGGGSLVWSGPNPPSWLQVRIQPWYLLHIGDTIAYQWPAGVFIPATPKTDYDDDGLKITVELYDKLLVLDQDKVEETYTVAAGTLVTTAVRNIIVGAGEEKHAIEDSSETLAAPMVWEAGTSKLAIINDLLAAINYFSLWVDGYGVYRGTPYVKPEDRGTAWVFADDAYSIYSPAFSHDEDTFSIPNKVVLVARTDGETVALTATATNTDPASPYSQPSRGRWLTYFESEIEATSQVVLNGIAARRLSELGNVASTYEIQHAPIQLDLNSIVKFERSTEGISARAVVQSMRVETGTGALVQTTLRETK